MKNTYSKIFVFYINPSKTEVLIDGFVTEVSV